MLLEELDECLCDDDEDELDEDEFLEEEYFELDDDEDEDDDADGLSLPLGELDLDLLPLLPPPLTGLLTTSFRFPEELPLLLFDDDDDCELDLPSFGLPLLLLDMTEAPLAGVISMPVSAADCWRRSMTEANFRFLDDEDEDDDEVVSEDRLEEDEEECPLDPGRFLPEEEDPLSRDGESCFLFLDDDDDELPFLSSLLLSSSERLLLMSLFDEDDDDPDEDEPEPRGMISMPPLVGFLDDDEMAAPSPPLAMGVIETFGVMSVTIVGGAADADAPSFLM